MGGRNHTDAVLAVQIYGLCIKWCGSCRHSKCVLDPVYVKLAGLAGDRNDIEPALVIQVTVVLLQEGFGGFTDFILLPAGDAFSRSTKSPVFSVAYFDKYQNLPVLHDQVDFSAFPGIVARNQRKPAGGKPG